MKTKKRFSRDQQILDLIDDCHLRAAEALREADRKEQWAMDAFKAGQAVEFAKEELAAACKLRRQAARLIDVRAKRLGRKLSELRTGLLPGTGITDASIPR